MLRNSFLLALIVSLILDLLDTRVAHNTILGLVAMHIDSCDVPLDNLSVHNVLLDLVTLVVQLLFHGLFSHLAIYNVIRDF